MLNTHPLIKFAEDTKPQLIVVIDTEEEFDWSAPPERENISVSAMSKIHLVQDIFNEYGIVPCYVVDYPIASQEQGYLPLKDYLTKGQCEIGAHLHPWVNPPFDEDVTISNMYPGNLGYATEKKKLQILQQQISNSFGINPQIYKAGRYGVGENTAKIMKELGFTIDLSLCSSFDYRADGGPDFSDSPTEPFWFGDDNSLLEIPLSGAFVGVAGKMSKHLYNASGYLNIFKARGILSRLSIVDRLMLSPEGYSTEEHIKLTRFLYNKGVRTFTWNFHSPTVVPSLTMYTKDNKQLQQFLDTFKRYFDFFLGELSGEATTPLKLKAQLERDK
ncbi:MAG: polysaccharide deacetylase family protein [Gammaproteobacteria bacterium]|nr:polysaccharide deacetylase family protein [Gammaproteobacteria bacterium]